MNNDEWIELGSGNTLITGSTFKAYWKPAEPPLEEQTSIFDREEERARGFLEDDWHE